MIRGRLLHQVLQLCLARGFRFQLVVVLLKAFLSSLHPSLSGKIGNHCMDEMGLRSPLGPGALMSLSELLGPLGSKGPCILQKWAPFPVLNWSI